MGVGIALTSSTVDQAIYNYTTQLRNLMQNILNLSIDINGGGNGTAVLEAAGYDSTDAATALGVIGILSNMSSLYFGTSTLPSEYNFNNELSSYWAGN
jgi:hypothetical protein